MHTLLLRLAGPMQSWGVQSRFPDRDTGYEPSKSGVVGLLCAACGIHRCENTKIAELAGLKMGVRVDQQGVLLYDYHTAQRVRVASASDLQVAAVLSGERGDPKGNILRDSVSIRHYLADASFLVGLEIADQAMLSRLYEALANPAWPLFLGRRAFVPSEPVWLPDGIRLGISLNEALSDYPWLGHSRCQWEKLDDLPVITDCDILADRCVAGLRQDYPLSFTERRFTLRQVETRLIGRPPYMEDDPCTSHD